MSLRIARRSAVAVGMLGLLLGVAAVPASADADTVSDEQWYAMADEAADEIEATDWEALSEQDGCELVDIEVTEVVDPELNATLGAPDDLAVPVVEREETCRSSLSSDLQFDDSARTSAIGRGSDCASTSGPGTLCIARSGSYITTSFTYRGSGSIKAFLRIYEISPSASGCPTGDTLATGSTSSYNNGTRRSLSVYSPSWDGYSSAIWRYVGLGSYTKWGTACGAM